MPYQRPSSRDFAVSEHPGWDKYWVRGTLPDGTFFSALGSMRRGWDNGIPTAQELMDDFERVQDHNLATQIFHSAMAAQRADPARFRPPEKPAA